LSNFDNGEVEKIDDFPKVDWQNSGFGTRMPRTCELREHTMIHSRHSSISVIRVGKA
jgi:hypothetical protein